jgi:membrane protein
MKKKFKEIYNFIKTTVKSWLARQPYREGAVMAYNAVFALPGLLVVVITLAGYFLGNEVITGHLHKQIAGAMGNDTADQVQQMVLMSMKIKNTPIAAIISVATIIIGATGVFVELQTALNNIWEVKADPKKSGIWTIVRSRLLSFGLIISIAFLLLISLVISSVLSAFGGWVQQYWSESLLFVFHIINFIFSLAVVTILFAIMFKFIPDAKVRWPSVWFGAFVTALLFVIGKTALGLYFGKSNPASVYGAAGSVVLILLWVANTSVIVFLGAEFTKVHSDHKYGEVPPEDHAVKEKKPCP